MDDVKYLDSETVFSTLSPAEAVASLREALAGDFDPSDDIPRTITDISAGNMIFMPSEIGDWVGVKLAGVSVGNPERGLPRIMAQYLMYDSATLELRTVIDGAALTTLRTPAVSVAAIEPALNRFTQPVNVVVFGAGPQGVGHADTIADVLDVEIADVTFVVRFPDQVTADVHDRGRVLEAQTAEVEAALRAADIIVTATTASEPLFSADLVRPGAVVMACGSHDPHFQPVRVVMTGAVQQIHHRILLTCVGRVAGREVDLIIACRTLTGVLKGGILHGSRSRALRSRTSRARHRGW